MSRKPQGYWKDFDHVRNVLEPLIEKYGRLPSNNELTSEGFSMLARAIPKYHGGSSNVAKLLGVLTYDESVGRRHQYEWNQKTVFEEFQRYLEHKGINYYPTKRELISHDAPLCAAIGTVFGSYSNFKDALKDKGITLAKKPRDSKYSWHKAVAILTPIVDELGYLPSNRELDNMGLAGLRGYLAKHKLHKNLLDHFDVTIKPRKYTVPREAGYWTNRENLIHELDQIFALYGRIPSRVELQKLGLGSLGQHLRNLDPATLSRYEFDQDSLLIRAKDGHVLRSVYELLFDNFLSYNKISHESEGLISESGHQRYLYDFKIELAGEPVYVEIWGYNRNRNELERNYSEKRARKERLYRELNLELLNVEADLYEKSFPAIYDSMVQLVKQYDSSFKPRNLDLRYFLWGSHYSIDDVAAHLKKIIVENDGYFPTTDRIRQENKGEGLLSMIAKFGGVSVFKKLLGRDIRPYPRKWSLAHLRSQLRQLNNLEYIPSSNELADAARLDILGGIQQNGGFKEVSRLLNVPTKSAYLAKHPLPRRTKWTPEYLRDQLTPILKEFGRFPNERELNEIHRGDLVSAIKKSGGFRKIKKQYGYDPSRAANGKKLP